MHKTIHLFTLAALTASALSACSEKDIPGEGEADADRDVIAFSATTRGGRGATDLGDFRCSAWNVTDNTPFFENRLFTKGSDGTWTTTPTVHWPADGQELTFYAWTPETTVDLQSNNPIVTAFGHAATVDSQKDLLLAKCTGSKSTAGKTPVPMLFRHALSKVSVDAKNNSQDYDVEVYGVSLRTLTGGSCTWHDEEGKVEWTGCSTPLVSATPVYTSPVTVGTKAASVLRNAAGADCFMMLTPYTLSEWNQVGQTHGEADNGGCRLAFKIRVTDKSDNSVLFPASGTYGEAWVPVSVDLAGRGGMSFAYTVDFTEGVGFWPDGASKPGTPILGQGVQVSVGTSDWGEDVMQNVDASTL